MHSLNFSVLFETHSLNKSLILSNPLSIDFIHPINPLNPFFSFPPLAISWSMSINGAVLFQPVNRWKGQPIRGSGLARGEEANGRRSSSSKRPPAPFTHTTNRPPLSVENRAETAAPNPVRILYGSAFSIIPAVILKVLKVQKNKISIAHLNHYAA